MDVVMEFVGRVTRDVRHTQQSEIEIDHLPESDNTLFGIVATRWIVASLSRRPRYHQLRMQFFTAFYSP